MAQQYGDQYAADTGNESLMKKYASKMDSKFGLTGLFIAIGEDAEKLGQEQDQALADRISKEIDYYNKLAEKVTSSPAPTQNTEKPAE